MVLRRRPLHGVGNVARQILILPRCQDASSRGGHVAVEAETFTVPPVPLREGVDPCNDRKVSPDFLRAHF